MRILTFALLAALPALPALAAQPDYLDDRSTPQAVISSFYNAINRQEYARAWSYYQDGQGVPKFAAFVKGYQDTASVRVGFGQPAQEGAAGSTYWTLPVSLDAVDRAGRHGYFSGCYTLRLANPAIHYFYPKEGYGIWSDNVVVLKEAKNVENAKLFQNFIMDPEIAAGLSAFHRYANGIAGSDKYMPADMKDAPEVIIPEDVKAQGEIQVLCSPEVQDIYSKIWTELQK